MPIPVCGKNAPGRLIGTFKPKTAITPAKHTAMRSERGFKMKKDTVDWKAIAEERLKTIESLTAQNEINKQISELRIQTAQGWKEAAYYWKKLAMGEEVEVPATDTAETVFHC